MAKTTKTTKANTGALDPTAMYQAGAAGAVATAKDKRGGETIKEIGNFILSYYLKSVENIKVAREKENTLFRTLDQSMIEADLDLDPEVEKSIQSIKNDITSSNKILNSPKWMLRPNHDVYIAAEEKKNNAMNSIENLKKNNVHFKTVFEQQMLMATNQLVLNEGTENERMVGISMGSTYEEVFNTSLLASGQLTKAITMDPKDGEYYVNWGLVTNWDDPATEVVETKESVLTEIQKQEGMEDFTFKKTNLKDMNFAKAENPYIDIPKDKDFVMEMTSLGMTNYAMDLSDNGVIIKNMINDQAEVMSGWAPDKLADFLFRRNGWKTNVSIVDQMIVDNTAEWDTDGVEGLSIQERLFAEEAIKKRILSGTYDLSRVNELYKQRGIKAYEEGREQWKIAHPEAKDIDYDHATQRKNRIRFFNFVDKEYSTSKANVFTIAGFKLIETGKNTRIFKGTDLQGNPFSGTLVQWYQELVPDYGGKQQDLDKLELPTNLIEVK